MPRRAATTIVLLSLLAVVAACGSDSKPAATAGSGGSSSASAQRRSITLLQTSHSLTFLPLYIAQQMHYFDDVNLDVDIADANGDGAANTALLVNGDGYALITGAEQAFLSQEKGIDLRTIMTMARTSPIALVPKAGFKSSGDLASDVRGKKVAMSGVGAPPHETALELLRSLGLDPDKDVTIVEGNDSARVAALKAGEADFAFLTEPSIQKVKRADVGGEPVLFAGDVIGDYASAAVMVLGKELDADPSTAQRVVDALVRAEQLIADAPDQALDAAKKEFSDVDPDVIAGAFASYQSHHIFSADGKLTDKAIATLRTYSASMAKVPESELDAAKAVDRRFTG